MTIVFESINCDLCNSRDFSEELIGKDREYSSQDKFNLVKCQHCGLIQLNPRPTIESMDIIYPKTYGFYQSRPDKNTNGITYPYLNSPTGKILDVGCSTGFTAYPFNYAGSLLDLKEQGWETYGCDISKEAAKVGQENGLNIKVGTINNIDFDDNFFDVIRFNHVLEHSLSPLQDLKRTKKLLKKNGIVIVSGPNINSFAYSLFKEYWSGLDLPRHFYQFTPLILKKYFKKLEFEIVAEYFDSIPADFMHSFKHVLNSKLVQENEKVCTEINLLGQIYTESVKFDTLLDGLQPIIDYVNQKELGDNYTIIAQK